MDEVGFGFVGFGVAEGDSEVFSGFYGVEFGEVDFDFDGGGDSAEEILDEAAGAVGFDGEIDCVGGKCEEGD